MKILTSMYTIKKGGYYDRFLMMLEAFLERGIEVHCLSLTPIPVNHYLFYNHRMYFPLIKVDSLISRILVLMFFPFWLILVGYIYRIDLIIAFGSLYAYLLTLSKKILKKEMVTFIRGESTFNYKIKSSPKYFVYLNKIIENVGILFSDRIITNNKSSKYEIFNCIKKIKDKDIFVLYNNIPLIDKIGNEEIPKIKKKYGIPENARILVTAGVINRGKNLEILIKCLAEIGMNNIYLLIAGDGSSRNDFHYIDYLKKLAINLKFDQRVIFTGWLKKEELWKIYQASDLFVMSSLNEGMPNAMLEALGCDLTCIGSDIPGIKDILKNEELMFNPKNEESMFKKISICFSDEQYLNKLKKLCLERKDIFIFDWKEKIFQAATQRIF